MLGHPIVLLACASVVLGHGRVTQPPSRASAWRLGFPTPANYDDDGLNCGGFSTQWSSNGGKCGICGDAYSIPPPRPHELGGTYGLGVIVAKYLPGATIPTTTHLTTSHMGYWQFNICPDPTDNSQACFDQHPLVSEDGNTKYSPTRGSGIYEVNYKLPSGLVCEHCVLQWRYVAGNNWGICSNGTSGLGCGNQEEFRACSDIAIGVSKTMSNVENLPSPLLYYLQHGFYELDQGFLTRKDPKRPTPPQRPTNTKPSNRQPKPLKETQNTQRQPNQHPQNSNRQPQHSNRSPQHSSQPPKHSNRQTQPSNRQPQYSNGQQYSQNQPKYSQQQSHNLQNYLQVVQFSQNPNGNAKHPQQLNRQTTNQETTSQRLTQNTQHHPQPSNRQPQPSYRQPQHSNRQPELSNRQPDTSHRLTQTTHHHSQSSNQHTPSSRQPQHSNRQAQHPNRQPDTSQRLTQTTHHDSQSSNQQIPSSRQPQHSNRQAQHSKPSKQQTSKHKSSKRQPYSKESKLLRYEYKTNDKRKTKNKRKKKKKTQPGLHQKTKKPKRPVKVYEHHTYEYF